MMSTGVSFGSKIAERIFRRLPDKGKRHVADVVAGSFEEIAYRRLSERGFRPAAIIDVGAYEGNWTRLVSNVFESVPILMIEAQEGKRGILENVLRDFPHARLEIAVLSSSPDELVSFYEMGTGSSLLSECSNVQRAEVKRTTRTLDDVAEQFLSGTDEVFLKIDVQGAELRVLAGAVETLKKVAVVQLEIALLQYNANAPLMPEVVEYMDRIGFLPIDVSGFSRMKGVLVQFDMIFARKGSDLRPEKFEF